MARFAVLLRGVNVGANNRIAMTAFRSLLEDLGCDDVQTYLQSGNAVVGWSGSGSALASAVGAGLAETRDLRVPVLVRSAADLDRVVRENPFADEDVDPKLLHAVFLSGPAVAGLFDVDALLPDRVVAGDRVLYIRYAGGTNDSPATKLVNSKRFPLVTTSRNWRTVLALQEMAAG